MKLNAVIGLALAGWMVACGGAHAETLKLSAATNSEAAAKAALAYAAKSNYSKPEVYGKQVFKLSLGTEVLGTLVSGSGLRTTDDEGRENSTCFVVLVMPDGKVALTPTVGFGQWETQSCISIDAVGTVSPQPQTGFTRIVVIHGGATGANSGSSPVVLAWNPKVRRLEIDLDGSNKADLAPGVTIAAVRKALQ